MKVFYLRIMVAIMFCHGWQIAYGDDQGIAKSLANELKVARETQALNDFKIGVRVEDGVVWMTGHVANAGQRDEALTIARGVEGVRLVVNDIAVGDAAQPAAPTNRQVVREQANLEDKSTAVMTRIDSRRNDAEAAPAAGFFAESTGYRRGQMVSHDQETPSYLPQGNDSSRFQAPPLAPAIRGNMNATGRVDRVSNQVAPRRYASPQATPVPMSRGSRVRKAQYCADGGCSAGGGIGGGEIPGYAPGYGDSYGGMEGSYSDGVGGPVAEMSGGYSGSYGGIGYENAQMPNYAWPSYAAHPNYAAVTYPKQYSPNAWPYIGPFYPYPQVPMGWRKVTLEWDDGWWMLDFNSK